MISKTAIIYPDVKPGENCIIEDYSMIGANSTLLPGIIISKRGFVGAGSVVTNNVSQNTVVADNPAVVINNIKELPYQLK